MVGTVGRQSRGVQPVGPMWRVRRTVMAWRDRIQIDPDHWVIEIRIESWAGLERYRCEA